MALKKAKIRYKKERVLLSEVLPYEVPATFSNRHFYEFLYKNEITYQHIQDDLPTDAIIKNLMCLVLGFDLHENRSQFVSIPFAYKISHREKEFRELVICHPKNQLKLIDFYDKYKALIIYYSSISPFSIRKPVRAAKFTFVKDKTHYAKLTGDIAGAEEFDKEYENLRSFFVYKDYNNVYKFYESYKFHRCEKKYNYLLKLDISKCFDSIYTHSISWALISKEAVKDTKKSTSTSMATFAGEFDKLMQELNHNETNGIIIGPEFSRIFAELILQSVDKSVERKLLEDKKLSHKTHYEIFRYVDDYFIFYNEEQEKSDIVDTLQHELKLYKLYLNSSKERTYGKPIITEITISKQYITEFLKQKLDYKVEEVASESICPEKPKGSIHIQSKSMITEFKTIIKQCGIEYQDILNYSLALVERYSRNILADYNLFQGKLASYYNCVIEHSEKGVSDYEVEFTKTKDRKEEQLIRAIIEIIEFTFFIYSVSPKVNTTIRLSSLLMTFVNFLNQRTQNKDLKHLVFKVISDNISFILNKNKLKPYTQVETLYLLLVLNELGKNYRLSLNALMSYFHVKSNASGELESGVVLNYFSITVLLMYIKNIKDYYPIKTLLEQEVILKFTSKKSAIRKDTELILLLMDSLACPFISTGTKSKLLNLYKIDTTLHAGIISAKKAWFTDWTGFNFSKELVAKRSKEVY